MITAVAFTEKQFANRSEFGRQILSEYYERYVNEWNKITVIEYMIRNVEVDGVPIKGKLDKIEFQGNEVNVVDYKTGNPKYGSKQTRAPSSYELPATFSCNTKMKLQKYMAATIGGNWFSTRS